MKWKAEKQKLPNLKNNEKLTKKNNFSDLWDYNKRSDIYVISVPES